MSKNELSFDEFRAVLNREKNLKKNNDKNEDSNSSYLDEKASYRAAAAAKSAENTTSSSSVETSKRGASSLGEILEMIEIQTVFVVLLLLDTFIAAAEVHFTHKNTLSSTVMTSMQLFTSFTLTLFGLELVALLVIFHTNILGHIGYILDFATLIMQIILELNGCGRETRILNIFRFWRLARLMNSIINLEKEAHNGTKALLENKNIELSKIEIENKRLEIELEKEKGAKESIEIMLQNYKEEVDTLNEALKIAAMDIAEVAQADDDYFISDDEEDVAEDVEVSATDGTSSKGTARTGDLYMDAPSSEYERMKSKDVLFKEVLASTNPAPKTATTFLVHDDGTFEKRS